MFDIADKHKLVIKIMEDVGYSQLGNKLMHIGNHSPDSIIATIETEFEEYGRKLVTAIISHLYTNQEFERDLGIIDK